MGAASLLVSVRSPDDSKRCGLVVAYTSMKHSHTREKLLAIFDTLHTAFGPRHWWPGDSPLEVMVGAILTQNTSWRNVERAIANMKKWRVLDMEVLFRIGEEDLAEIIRPAGFYRIKSRRLKAFIADFQERFDGLIEHTAAVPTGELRDYLLAVNGIGPETADSILLYALDRPVFVVDAYTKRFLKHHGLYDGDYEYHHIQKFFMDNLPRDTYIFNEFHALIVRLCQEHCKKRPDCSLCPVSGEDVRARLHAAG
jgi:endonuclease-3 related protein